MSNNNQIKIAVFQSLVWVRASFLPKASPKEMLPIVDKPLIQYAAEEAVDAGVETLILLQAETNSVFQTILIKLMK